MTEIALGITAGADARMRAPNKAGGKAAKWTENILSLPAHPVFQGPVPDGWKINGHGAYESLSRLLGFDDKAGDDTEAAPGERSFVMHGPGYVCPSPSLSPAQWVAMSCRERQTAQRSALRVAFLNSHQKNPRASSVIGPWWC